MIILLAVLCSLILITLGIIAVFNILTYNRIAKLLVINGAYQAEEYRNAVAVQKSKKPPMKAVKQIVRGRSINNQEELIDLTELPLDEAIKIAEDIGKQ